MDYNELALALHRARRGKIEVTSKVELATRDDLSVAYTPGVAEPCRRIAEQPDAVYEYTAKGNLVAVVSDGTAVLGLGDIGAAAAIPVMEGKAVLFKEFGGVDAFPICLATTDDEAIVSTVKNIAPVFGGINLEDIGAPRCFYIERRLREELDIPVFHDDQHGTAVCVLAALINAAQVVGKPLTELSVVVNGIGAAGTAIAEILLSCGLTKLLLTDRHGILNSSEPLTMLHWKHRELAARTNPQGLVGDLAAALVGADVFIGVSRPELVTPELVSSMNERAIVLAMANPTPEIFPEAALAAGAAVVGTGRSDYPNQINNVLVFPGIFKGALRVRASEINEEMKLAAATALAACIPPAELRADCILPSPLERSVAEQVATAVAAAAVRSGVAAL